ncbi:S-adenosyl-L-methionine:benzoic acid/salicylic acid carboxyl methyltransferase 3-like [Mercurialis annua]|uniref:S-adenosyl-L-methionine:benzoic acid/salicylic acid carboxyl methyltransferase 3-like n=1 Tax=Mercurialis annua TaxID=3986 RepID=UPI00215F47BC|nr:S-adenosyl-L-methionine:benzoic acid/salicylic acid carboxyl methyltransferase 3-like [Mercurialis annua]
MEVVQVLHMNSGNGETSYAQNSVLQQRVILRSKPTIKEAITNLYNNSFPKRLAIADFGCSSGPNTLFAVSEIIDVVEKICENVEHEPPEYNVFLNDLPSNDFNTVFKSLLPDFRRRMKEHTRGLCFISGTPGSFYGRLFPSNTLHFAYSSYSLHWLSQIPRGLESNKGNIYMSSTSPPCVLKAYYVQFQMDFSMFLKCRSKEMIAGGRMVLTFQGRRSKDPCSKEGCYMWDLLAIALNQFVREGMIDEEKFHSFNIPYYTPSPCEVKNEIEKEESFHVDTLELYEQDWNESGGQFDPNSTIEDEGSIFGKCARAIIEPYIRSHFDFQKAMIDKIFARYSTILKDCMAKERTWFVNIIVSMTKKGAFM